MSARQRSLFSSSWMTSLTPSMNSGNDSNCVHWSYAVLTGTLATVSFSIRAMCSLPLRGLDQVGDRAVPCLQEIVRVEDVILRESARPHIVALDDRDARLAAHGARELHDQRLWLRSDATDGAARESRPTRRALHGADALQDGPD